MEAQGQTEETSSAEPTAASIHVNAAKASGVDGQAKRSAREDKGRKNDKVEYVLRTLSTLSPEEKLSTACKKYVDAVDEIRRQQVLVKQAEKRLGVLQREKEQLQTEHSKAVLTRSRLESLCRELQRQNKAVKDESLLKIREEEEKRKEVSNKFQSTLTEITTLMQQNNEKNSKLREDNLEMTKKFKSLCEQYEMREQQVEKMTRQMQLESQLADAKLAKAQLEIAAEKEASLREKQQILLELQQYQAKCQELQATEVNLRSQISLYTDKYDEFQNALTRSNEVFGGFKGEMDKMSKRMGKLQKEALMWKGRWEKSHQTLLEMAEDKQKRDAELAQTSRKLVQLQKLCRTLQAERTALHSQLRALDVKGQQGDVAGSITSELQSVCDRLTETLGSLQLSPENTLDQAECPSKMRLKAQRSSSDATAVASSPCATASQLPRGSSCGFAEDTSMPKSVDAPAEECGEVAAVSLDAGQECGDQAGTTSDALMEPASNETLPKENTRLATTECKVQAGVGDGPETAGVVVPSLGICYSASSPDMNCVCSLTMPQLECSSSVDIPGQEIDLVEEESPAIDLQHLSCCCEEENNPSELDICVQSQLPDGVDAQVDVASAERIEASDSCMNISNEILFKPLANGHAILLPEDSLPLEIPLQNEVKKRKDAGKKRKK